MMLIASTIHCHRLPILCKKGNVLSSCQPRVKLHVGSQINKEVVIEITRLNPFDRFPDGRRRVSDELLESLKNVATEQAWGILNKHGYAR